MPPSICFRKKTSRKPVTDETIDRHLFYGFWNAGQLEIPRFAKTHFVRASRKKVELRLYLPMSGSVK